MENKTERAYRLWCEKATDGEIAGLLRQMEGDSGAIGDAFYRSLEFGTAGLRGVIGAGTNRMNIYTVGIASQGIADFVNETYAPEDRKIAVSYDSRIKSDLFAQYSSGVFAANGIKVYIYPQLMPTPCLSYAVRKLGCAAGIMITASHNPSEYNGYKVYGSDGCQLGNEAADRITDRINALDIFADVKTMDFDRGIESGKIEYIGEDVYADFIAEVKKQSVLEPGDRIDRNVSIVYSPLHGTGLKPVLRALSESGFANITVVKEQEEPDGNFTTCPYPNPELPDAMKLGLEYADKYGADLFLANDPDCDRVGVAVRGEDGKYVLLTGNQIGLLLLDYICKQRIKKGTMPENPVMIKTVVTTDMADRIAEKYGVRTVNVLTGFKYIGEQIGLLEARGAADSYIFGFEESCGYLSGSYVRDKDGVNASFLICEMFAYYKTRGISLTEKLNELYKEFGYTGNTLYSYYFKGESGMGKMKEIMKGLRTGIGSIGGRKVIKALDYLEGIDGLPKSDVIKFMLEGNCSATVRPSGTEPKIKLYLSVCAADEAAAAEQEKLIKSDIEKYLA